MPFSRRVFSKSLKPTAYVQHHEYQYLQLIETILSCGVVQEGRNAKTYSINGTMMRFPLVHKTLPLLTTKRMPWKTVSKELIWFLKGKTSNKWLTDRHVHIWDKNANTKEVKERNDQNGWLPDDLGPVYGHQWRHFNASYCGYTEDYDGKGVDQLKNIIHALEDPDPIVRSSRRLIMSAWNPCQIDQMALPPCHVLSHFLLRNDRYLDCIVYQRSGDVGLGVPFNIASYSALTHLIANHTGKEAGDFIYIIGNAHIYEDHIDTLKEQMNREPYPFPDIEINKKETIDDYDYNDMKIKYYVSHPKLDMNMTA